MDPTRRWWSHCLLVVALAGAAVIFQRPLLLVGAAVLAAFLLASQYDCYRTLTQIDQRLSVTQSVTPSRVTVDDPAQATLSVSTDEAVPNQLTGQLSPPSGVRVLDSGHLTATLTPESTETTTTAKIEVPVAGVQQFEQAIVTIEDQHGFFTESLRRGPTPTLTAQPRTPRNIHVGEGGEDVVTAFGEHETGKLGSGLEPAELREYQPGDAARQIDWKATARLNDPHVQEFEAETDRTVAMIIDHRPSMETGPRNETKCDYAREVALSLLDTARDGNDSIGLYSVAQDGLTATLQPAATTSHFERVRTQLLDLEPIDGLESSSGPSRSPRAAGQAATRLNAEASLFANTLQPYFETTETYVERVSEDPIFSTIETYLTRLQGTVWTVIFTDDTHRAELLEAAKHASHRDNYVLVFLTPTVLYEPGVLSDLDSAYDRYREFETFRQRLNRLQGVSAFEVGPGDRIDAVLNAQQTNPSV